MFQLMLLPCTFLSDFDNNDRTARKIYPTGHRYVVLLVSPPSSQKRRPIEEKRDYIRPITCCSLRPRYVFCSSFPLYILIIKGKSFILWLSQCFCSDFSLFLIF
jgi:hypothetical protein